VGIVSYKKLLGQGCKLSEVATPSDEALTLLLIENSIHRWTREFEVREEKGDQHQIKEDELLPTKYTSAGYNKRQKGLTKRYKGWTQAGIQRFNEILDQVKEDRRMNGTEFDECFAAHLKSFLEEDNIETQENTYANWTKAKNDLFDGTLEQKENNTPAGDGITNRASV
jgi:hypothetical protein